MQLSRSYGLGVSAATFFLLSALGHRPIHGAAGASCSVYYEGVRSPASEPEHLNSAGLVLAMWSSQPMSADGSSCFANGVIAPVCMPMSV